MFHSNKVIFTALIISFVSFNSLVQAAPALQDNTQNDSLGDSFNLDDEGNVLDDGGSGGNNLGKIMSGKNNDDGLEEPADDAPADQIDDDPGDGPGDGLDDVDDDDDLTDDPTGDGAPADEAIDDSDEATEDDDDVADDDPAGGDEAMTEPKQHPVAAAIAEYFDVPYEEIMSLHENGYGFGNITKAYFFAKKLNQMNMDMEGATPVTPEDLLNEAHGSGWGNVLKDNDIHPGAVGNGAGKHADQFGQPEHAGKPDKFSETDGDAISKFSGQGGGHSQGGGHGQGKGKGFSAKSGDDNDGGKGNGNSNKGDHEKGKGKGKNK
ncbi:MAG: hypothetical protein H6631_18105 [Anaerolineaceae bacterium]|nr:hypothetical protein [Anaerolineaceae bacterium]MCB9101101.1 hypothetical protein [Anaerolineales bacterium]